MSIEFQKVPPHSNEAEQSVLGAMLLDKEAISSVTESIKGEDFYREAHREIFEAVVEIFNKGEPVDLITLAERLKSRKTLDVVGGVSYLTSLMDMVPVTHNVRHYSRIVEDKALLRRLILTSSDIMQRSFEGKDAVSEIVEKAEKNIFEISLKHSTAGPEPIGEILHTNFDMIEELYKNKGRLTGVPSGFTDLDRMLSGLQPSELILIAARPSMGKSSFMMNIVQHAAVREKTATVVFSLEMSKEQLSHRLLCSEALIDSQKLRTGDIDEDDWVKLAKVVSPLSKAPIFIDDTPAIGITEIRAKCRKLRIEHNLGLVCIDYLQLMSGSGSENRQQEISEISRSLKALARELKIPVVALSQLSRAAEQRVDHRPILSDLRESGAIEQDADVVMFLYRDEYYNKESEKKNIGEVIISKQRNGPTGSIELVWLGQFTKFANKERDGFK